MHECAVPHCGREIAASHLMCPFHWRLVPPATQREVYAAWSAVETQRRLRTDRVQTGQTSTELQSVAFARAYDRYRAARDLALADVATHNQVAR